MCHCFFIRKGTHRNGFLLNLYANVLYSPFWEFNNLIKTSQKSFDEVATIITTLNETTRILGIKNNYESLFETIEKAIKIARDKDNFEMLRAKQKNSKNQKERLESWIENLIKEAKDITSETVEKINKSVVLTKIISNENLNELLKNTDDLKSIFLFIRHKKPLLVNRYINNCADELKEINDCLKEYKQNYENNTLEQTRIKTDLKSINEEIAKYKKYFQEFDLELATKGQEIEKQLVNISLDSSTKKIYNYYVRNKKFLDENIDNLWKKHIKNKAKIISSVREFVISKMCKKFHKRLARNPDFHMKVLTLKKYINNKLQHKRNTINKLFFQEIDTLSKIFPCIMLNPELVPQIIDKKPQRFDYAIFDEASQIRLHKALPAIHRAKKIIVAGDDKQLGPTDLFTDITTDEDYEYSLAEDADFQNNTLLDFAKDRYAHFELKSHYRSKSKDLITFSNANFYNNSIHIADSPLARYDGKPAIILEEINGFWTEQRTNPMEAKRAVELAIYYLVEQKKSLGIITFNDNQANNIRYQIEQAIDPSYLSLDNFFVKPIKDIQGDERDVIIFSITYGRRQVSNQYVAFFGQFSKEKINVAITRAKLRNHILKSIPSSEINARNDDYRIFKDWLRHIEDQTKNKNISIENHINKFRSSFEEDFYEALVKKVPEHIIILANWNVGSKEIDVVLYDNQSFRFVGAIELDGAKFHSSLEKIGEDYERQVFLENMGWRFVRISWHNFYKNREKAVDLVLNTFEIANQIN